MDAKNSGYRGVLCRSALHRDLVSGNGKYPITGSREGSSESSLCTSAEMEAKQIPLVLLLPRVKGTRTGQGTARHKHKKNDRNQSVPRAVVVTLEICAVVGDKKESLTALL